jgi:hypothetical protein
MHKHCLPFFQCVLDKGYTLKGESYLFANDKLIEKKKVDDETDMGEDKSKSEVSSDGS